MGKADFFGNIIDMRATFLFIFILLGCSSPAPTPSLRNNQSTGPVKSQVLEIYEVNPSKATALTKQNLYQMIQIYDLSRFLYTHRVKIQEDVPPRSHPILTINTDFSDSPNKIMAQWLHQQFHWWANSRPKSVWRAIGELKKVYPEVPGNSEEEKKQVYLHFIINYLEFRTLGKHLGYHQTHRIITEMFKQDDHYTWVYQQVFRNPAVIRKVLRKHRLIPKAIY